VAARLKGLTDRSVSVVLDGGRLRIEWSEGENVFMTGPAEEVYTGVVET
jgi:diaminopimelate epimerase